MSHTKHILIVEDEISIRELLRVTLKQQAYQVSEANTVQQAWQTIIQTDIDLVLLDWMLPDQSGIELVKKVKAHSATQEIPIIMLTARAEEQNKCLGLDLGVDDYITKPFSPKELQARIRAILRRGPPITPAHTIHFKELSIDVDNGIAQVGSQTIELTKQEFKLLYYLMRHKSQICSRQKLLNALWPQGEFVEDRTVDQLVKRLRQALHKYDIAHYIHTIRNMGYKFDG